MNVVLLIASFWYVRANTVMLKFSVFLLLAIFGTLLSTMSHTTPVITAYIKPDSPTPMVLRDH